MRENLIAPKSRFTGAALRLAACTSLLALLSLSASAQRATDGSTPSGLAPGSPAGSYPLSDLDTVNLYNGSLNFHLPLLKVGGRGAAGYPVSLNLEQKWTVHKQQNAGQPTAYWAEPTWWNEDGVVRPYAMGRMHVRRGKSDEYDLRCNPATYVPRETLTRITFTAPDGTEYDLRDQQTDGQPVYPQCSSSTQGFNRGRVFVTSDGSSATFISDTDIIDIYDWTDDWTVDTLTGYLLLKDGTRFRVSQGNIKWMRDPDGNKLSFDYDIYGRVTTITDSLNRQVTISYGAAGSYDQINFSGFGGAARTIKVGVDYLQNVLRGGQTLLTSQQLFPELNATSNAYNPTVYSYVELPDGRRYQFQYNSYAELARVVLPTGGAVEYDYAAGLTDGYADGVFQIGVKKFIYRRAIERRVYPDGGTGSPYASKSTYSRPETNTTNLGYVTEEQCAPGGTTGQCGTGASLLTRSYHYYYGSPRASFAQTPTQYASWKEGKEYKSEAVDPSNNAILRRAESIWQQPVAGTTWPLGQAETNDAAKPNSPQITQAQTTLVETNQVSAQTFAYDRYANKTDVYEYDYGLGAAGPLARRTHTDFVTTNATGGTTYDYTCDPATTCSSASINPNVIHMRGLPSRQSVYNATGVEQARTTFEYDNYATDATHAALIPRASITGLCAYFDAGSNCYSPDDPNHLPTSYVTRGNVTATTRYLLTNGTVTGSVTAYQQYDVAGNVVESIDANGNASTVSYADSFCNDNARCGGSFTPSTYAFPKSMTSPTPDASTLYGYQAGTFGLTTAFTTSTVYDYYTGLIYSTTDANGQTTTLSYKDTQGNFDPLDRLKAVVRPDGSCTDYNYGDTVGNLYVQVLSDLDSGRRTESRQYFDGLGRGVRSFRWENQDASNPWLTVDTQYDALGRMWSMSNQYRSAGPGSTLNPSGRWTQTTFDALGRATQVVTTADGAPMTTTYSGDKVLVTDQAGKQRMSRSDALGRLTDVWEVTPADPSTETVTFQGVNYTGYHTPYGYDVLGNLRTVTQAGQQNGQQVTQQRSFVYDSLSRLTSATNPESGTVSYTYDPDGNLQTKTDSRGVTATYRYDHLNRNIIVTYTTTGTTSAATPTAYRYYDFAANGLGRLYRSEAEATAQTTFTNYDQMGRPTQYEQKFWTGGAWGQEAYTVQRGYNLAGGVISERYPSQHTVSYNYDVAGRLGDNSSTGQAAFAGNLGDGAQRTYSSQVVYDPTGGMNQERFGTDTPVYNKHFY
ncbi:MAG: RHS repeat protein, partial [Acidobacteriota bacterium]|nr:RHS repeat protein [Acidobacteriota bacterium]